LHYITTRYIGCQGKNPGNLLRNLNIVQVRAAQYLAPQLCDPGSCSDINLLGTGQADAYHSQVIGWNVEVGGTADTFVLYNGGEQYSRPATLELYR